MKSIEKEDSHICSVCEKPILYGDAIFMDADGVFRGIKDLSIKDLIIYHLDCIILTIMDEIKEGETDWNNIHALYEMRVVERTLGRNRYLGETEFDPVKRTWFLDANPIVPIYRFTPPGILAIQMAYETYFGTNILGESDSDWNYWFMRGCIDKKWYESQYWPEDKSWKQWSSDSEPGDTTMYNFVKRTEQLLNRAISYVASALNWVIDQVQGYTCKPNPNAELSAGEAFSDVFTGAAADLLFVGFFKAMTYIGSFAAVYAIPMSSKFLK